MGARFGEYQLNVNDVLVKYTFFGDADVSGRVTTNDYFQIDNGFLNSRTGWINGDFDYDGAVTTSDYFLIDNGFLGQGAGLVVQVEPVAVVDRLGAARHVVQDAHVLLDQAGLGGGESAVAGTGGHQQASSAGSGGAWSGRVQLAHP